jgi:uncharacterized protein (DUF2132 family)
MNTDFNARARGVPVCYLPVPSIKTTVKFEHTFPMSADNVVAHYVGQRNRSDTQQRDRTLLTLRFRITYYQPLNY